MQALANARESYGHGCDGSTELEAALARLDGDAAELRAAERARCVELCEAQDAFYRRRMAEAWDEGRHERWERYVDYSDAARWLGDALRSLT